MFPLVDVSETDAALKLAAFRCLNILQFLEFENELAPLVQCVQARAKSGQTINNFSKQVDRKSALGGDVVEKNNIEEEVATHKKETYKVQNKLLLKPLLPVIELQQLNLVPEVVLNSLQEQSRELNHQHSNDLPQCP